VLLVSTPPLLCVCVPCSSSHAHHRVRSDKPAHGNHVSRLAADLRDVLGSLDVQDATLCGASMCVALSQAYAALRTEFPATRAVLTSGCAIFQGRCGDLELHRALWPSTCVEIGVCGPSSAPEPRRGLGDRLQGVLRRGVAAQAAGGARGRPRGVRRRDRQRMHVARSPGRAQEGAPLLRDSGPAPLACAEPGSHARRAARACRS